MTSIIYAFIAVATLISAVALYGLRPWEEQRMTSIVSYFFFVIAPPTAIILIADKVVPEVWSSNNSWLAALTVFNILVCVRVVLGFFQPSKKVKHRLFNKMSTFSFIVGTIFYFALTIGIIAYSAYVLFFTVPHKRTEDIRSLMLLFVYAGTGIIVTIRRIKTLLKR
ncbi:MAG: hypothetical protein KC582_01320 [Candidatus Magasanikbacteria bacterium]|nr:hypothetical protein [Candidatus Magasanikbacteria bacterium]MCA9390876.1 hypothetical protein [Candidatus Magasanikbacteria bacterium]